MAMRLEAIDGDDGARVIGAAVIRKHAGGDIILDLGPADGPPLVRIRMGYNEAQNLAGAIRNVADGGDETVLIVDD
jgi:hypothetical protein